MLSETPPVWKGSSKLFRSLKERGELTSVPMHFNIDMDLKLHVCVSAYMYIYTYVCMYLHICVYTYIYMLTYVTKCKCFWVGNFILVSVIKDYVITIYIYKYIYFMTL